MKPFIDPAFWSDPDIEGSKAGVKLTSLWLITNSQTSLLGICGSSVARFEFETGLKAEALETTIQALPRAFRKFGSVIFIRNYIRHQFGSGDKLTKNNFFVALKSLFLSIRDEELQSFILSEYPEFNQALHKPLEGLTKPKERKGKERGVFSVEGDPLAECLCKIFSRRTTTAWTTKEISAYRSIGTIPEDDLCALERYYASERAKGEDGRQRRDLATFLNNFAGELDRARQFATKKKRIEPSFLPTEKPHTAPKTPEEIAEYERVKQNGRAQLAALSEQLRKPYDN